MFKAILQRQQQQQQASALAMTPGQVSNSPAAFTAGSHGTHTDNSSGCETPNCSSDNSAFTACTATCGTSREGVTCGTSRDGVTCGTSGEGVSLSAGTPTSMAAAAATAAALLPCGMRAALQQGAPAPSANQQQQQQQQQMEVPLGSSSSRRRGVQRSRLGQLCSSTGSWVEQQGGGVWDEYEADALAHVSSSKRQKKTVTGT
jgi:hypothetical protein